MRTKKLLALLCAAALVFPAVATVTNADAKAAESTQIVDEMTGSGWQAPTNVPLNGTYSPNIYYNTDFSGSDYGTGGDTTGWKMHPAETNGLYLNGYAEYNVANENIDKVSAEYYFLETNGCLPYIKLDLNAAAFAEGNTVGGFAVGQNAGNDIVHKWIDMETGAVYINVKGTWYLYCDEVGAEGSGWWSYVKTLGIWGFEFPDESKLIPWGGGFQYTTDGTTWTWATPTIESVETNGGKNKEVWSASVPTNAQKIRVHLTDRATYLTAYNPYWESGPDVRPSFSTRSNGIAGWYFGISKVTFNVKQTTPEELGQVLVGYAADGKLYSKAYAAANVGVAFEEVYADFGMKDGASVRLEEPTGLRFRAEFVKADYDNLVALVGAENVKLGMRVVRGGTAYLDIEAKNTVVSEIDNVAHVVFNGVIVNIAAANYQVNYCGTGYVDVTFADGVTERIYAVAGDNTRTVAQVAKAAYEQDNTLTQLKKYFEEA